MASPVQEQIAEEVSSLPESRKREVLEFVRRLAEQPEPVLDRRPEPAGARQSRRVRLSGLVRAVTDSSFELSLADGSTVRGLWQGDRSKLGSFAGSDVLMEGIATYERLGDLADFQSHTIRLARPEDGAFSRTPSIRSVQALRRLAEPGTGALSRIVGRWPGNETDEEIDVAITALS